MFASLLTKYFLMKLIQLNAVFVYMWFKKYLFKNIFRKKNVFWNVSNKKKKKDIFFLFETFFPKKKMNSAKKLQPIHGN